ncbi:MAG: cell division protein FtsQ/DivIB [Ginsengibacter sp.]
MATNKTYKLKKILTVSVWFILSSGVIVLLVAAMSKKNTEHIKGVEIRISGIQNNYFIDKSDVLKLLTKVNGKKLEKSTVAALDLTTMEKQLEKNDWIRKAELFFDNNKVLQVKISEREPIARLFTVSGASFYIDSSLNILPLSDKFSARLPVFTGFPAVAKKINKQDSALLVQVKLLSQYINEHPFWMAQIDQVDISSERHFDFIPKLGNQVIRFGDTDNYQQKFNKLLAFYQQVESKIGWNKYAVVDVQYKNQVVGVVRDAAEIKSDSLRAVEIMKQIISEAEKNTNDSTKIQLPQPKDDNERVIESPVLDNPPVENPATEKSTGPVTPIHHHEKPILKKQISAGKKPETTHSSSNERPRPTHVVKPVEKKQDKQEKRVPKAVMPAKSDY